MKWRLQWQRDSRTSSRPLLPADRRALREVIRGERWQWLGGTLRDLDVPEAQSQTGATFVWETDQQLVGALQYRSGVLTVDLGPLPWSNLEAPKCPLETEPTPCETLWVTALGLRAAQRYGQTCCAPVGKTLATECRRVGAKRIVVPVPLAPNAPESASLSDAALLQQIHHGSVPSERLTPFLDAGFELRGFQRPSDRGERLLYAVAAWRHPRL